MAFDEGTKERREKKVETLIRMRNKMMESDDWESHKDEIEAVTLGGMAIQRLNRIDFGGEDVIIPGKEYSYNEYEIEHRGSRRNTAMPTGKSEMKPCPFCGSTRILFDRCTLRVRCKGCFATSGTITGYIRQGMKEEEAAMAAWNTRYEEDDRRGEE